MGQIFATSPFDVDVVVAVSADAEAEAVVHDLQLSGYRVVAVVEGTPLRRFRNCPKTLATSGAGKSRVKGMEHPVRGPTTGPLPGGPELHRVRRAQRVQAEQAARL